MEFPFRGKLNTEGTESYDKPNQRYRVDDKNGNFDKYCGSVFWFTNTPCSRIIRDDAMYLSFPEKKFCCKCCQAKHGCGMPKGNWMWSGQPYTKDDVHGIHHKYVVQGNSKNYNGVAADFSLKKYDPII
jgi:hypothetical protein